MILHPFAGAGGPEALAASSRASLMLQGIIPSDEFALDTLAQMVLEGRYYELRMLFYIGKDLERWIEQCLDFAARSDALSSIGLKSANFAALLVEDPPLVVKEKLQSWGVLDYRTIFARALGLHAVFTELPARDSFTEEFVRHYHRYVDQFFDCRQKAAGVERLGNKDFQFEMYSSGEYSRLLERQWEGS